MARPKTVQSGDLEGQEQAALEAEETLPPAGHARREEVKRRGESLQAEIERQAANLIMGRLDPKALKVHNEIASRTQYMHVSNADPNCKYAWISKNNHSQHIRALEQQGWRTVQGDDPEALELKGTSGVASGTGTPDSTRQIGDVILMKVPKDVYVALQARKHARTIQLQQSSASDLLSLADRYRKYVKLRTVEGAPDMGQNFEGPPIQPQRFSSNPAARRAALDKLDAHLRAGDVPGMELQQR